jgi:hypothetical protein
MLDHLSELNSMSFEEFGDPEIQAAFNNIEMAYRMQTAVPELADLTQEPDHIIKMYGSDCLVPGTYASNCLRCTKALGIRCSFVQLYHQGWDHHGNMVGEMPATAEDVDRATAALVMDLKQRGLLNETLVIWGGEFGRTNYCQGNLSKENMEGTITLEVIPYGWQVVEVKPAQYMDRLMTLAITLLKIRFTSTTSMLPSCISWDSIMKDSPSKHLGRR